MRRGMITSVSTFLRPKGMARPSMVLTGSMPRALAAGMPEMQGSLVPPLPTLSREVERAKEGQSVSTGSTGGLGLAFSARSLRREE
jgi:hypothetical protein